MNIVDESDIPRTLSRLPSIDALLRAGPIQDLIKVAGSHQITAIAREQVDLFRIDIQKASFVDANTSAESLRSEAVRRVERAWQSKRLAAVQRVINATGVIIHTNLGRAPLSDEAGQALLRIASGYCSVEYDLRTGSRGLRGRHAEELLCELTRAESAIVVNNCAAAAFLVMSVFAAGAEAIISRGELVEIGGDFRIPEVIERSGGKLREVGTTNRTKISDYEKAIGADTRLILRVHPSNFRIIGFTSSVSNAALADLAHARGLIMFEDAGSGALIELSDIVGDEPVISQSIGDGVDMVSFSGDKLLGGPQCGIIVGRYELIEELRNDPLYRALRVGKLTYAALEATLESYSRGSAFKDIPVLQMLAISYEDLVERCRSFLDKCTISEELKCEVVQGHSVVGGGSSPDVQPLTPLIAVSHSKISAERLDSMLREADTPIIARIERDRVLLDLRTVALDDESELCSALTRCVSKNLS